MNIKKAVISALAYHDIFEYPLNEDEILDFLEVKSNPKSLKKVLLSLEKNNLIKKEDEYYYLDNKNVIFKRKTRLTHSKKKNAFIILYTILLSLIPSIEFIGLTGALAMSNSKKNDDIDLMIISSRNSVWSTRLIANLVLIVFKRRPKEKKQNNKACLNIFLDKQNLLIQNQSLYTAHELVQTKVLLNRNRTYEELLKTNKWVHKYLPNWKPNSVKASYKLPVLLMPNAIEAFLAKLQLKYMKNKKTSAC